MSDLDQRRANRDGFHTCFNCACAYFHLIEYRADGTQAPGVVTLGPRGGVDGHTGTPVCANCGLAATYLGPPPAAQPDAEGGGEG